MIPDVGADILDLAETMIMSNGLKYEPVSTTVLRKVLIIYPDRAGLVALEQALC